MRPEHKVQEELANSNRDKDQALGKADLLEGARRAGKAPIKWVGLGGFVLICAVAILHLALDRGDAWGRSQSEEPPAPAP